MLLFLLKLYILIGSCWTCFFTGLHTIKAIKGHYKGILKVDGVMWLLLSVMFVFSWLGWPWSMMSELPHIGRHFEKGGNCDV